MRRFSTHLRRLPERAIVAAGIALAVAVSGCVTRGNYNEVVAERTELETKRKRLKAKVALLIESNKHIDAERVRVADAYEDLRQRNVVLTTDLGKVRKSEALLSEHLEDREQRLSSATRARAVLRPPILFTTTKTVMAPNVMKTRVWNVLAQAVPRMPLYMTYVRTTRQMDRFPTQMGTWPPVIWFTVIPPAIMLMRM